MPLFRRDTTPEFAAPIDPLPCSDQSCTHETAIMCAYQDRRGRTCSMAFCPDHRAEVGGVAYCRRHAGTISAMGEDAKSGALPELENRGPSLVSWVADEIGPEVEELLRAAARDGETVKTECAVKGVFDRSRRLSA